MSAINDIFEGLIQPKSGDFSPQHAQFVIGLRFTEEQLARYEELAQKNKEGGLNEEELAELDAYLAANAFLMILQSKARRSLLQQSPAPAA